MLNKRPFLISAPVKKNRPTVKSASRYELLFPISASVTQGHFRNDYSEIVLLRLGAFTFSGVKMMLHETVCVALKIVILLIMAA